MLFDPADSPHLKPWLIRTLEPICDAEPSALGDYVLALLKHNVQESELRKEMEVQLEEFLEKECAPFLDTLFAALRSKTYLPYSASASTSLPAQSLDTGIPIPLDGLLSPPIATSPERGIKRSLENDERDGRPTKGPRLSAEAQFTRYNNNGRGGGPQVPGAWGSRDRPQQNGYRDGPSHLNGGGMMNLGNMGNMVNMGGNGMTAPPNGRRPQSYLPPDQNKRGVCRDYHNSGYCSRGAFCKYSHGEDAVVPGQLFPTNGGGMQNGGMPFMPMFANGYGMPAGAVAAYDPHEARMDMRSMNNGRPQLRPPLLPRMGREDGSRTVHTSGELPVIQDLTPNIPANDVTPNPTPQSNAPLASVSVPPRDMSAGLPQPNPMMNGGPMAAGPHMNGNVPIPQFPPDVEMAGPRDREMHAPMRGRGGGFRNGGGGGGGGMRGGGMRGHGHDRVPGTFNSEAPNFRPERKKDITLVVEKIPEDKLTLDNVNEWFKRFGSVTNVAIDKSTSKALVSFSTHEEAYAAWKSEDAVFSNRFVKVFWHRPMEGHGQVGSRMLAASAPLIANMGHKDTSVPPPPNPSAVRTSSATSISRKSSTQSGAAAAALAAKQQLLTQQIDEQKALMASLDGASPDEKKSIMARLRKLGEEMTSAPTSAAATAPAPSAGAAKAPVDREQSERERLDKELEMHSVNVAVEGEDTSAEDLKAKLEKLKAEAASLGITEAAQDHSYGGSYRGYRGRGRGAPRGYTRGAARGGPPRSMKLDNRPKRLLVKGVDSKNVQALQDWYETTGQMESLITQDNGDIVVTFHSRAAAEQGLAKGSNVSTVGPVQVSWHTGAPPTAPSVPKAASPSNVEPAKPTVVQTSQPPRIPSPEPEKSHSSHTQEEEIVASGWGDGDEDGMGML